MLEVAEQFKLTFRLIAPAISSFAGGAITSLTQIENVGEEPLPVPA